MTTSLYTPEADRSGGFDPIGEADHRIANSLQLISSLIRLRARRGAFDNPRDFLLEIADRIDDVSGLHRVLAHSAGGPIEVEPHLSRICERVRAALASPTAQFTLTCDRVREAPSSVILTLGLILSELLSNSLKYAHPAGLPVNVDIRCDQDETGAISLAYEDDGVGFPEGFDPANGGGLGMKFITAMARKLGATYLWRSDPLGLRFEILVPSPGF